MSCLDTSVLLNSRRRYSRSKFVQAKSREWTSLYFLTIIFHDESADFLLQVRFKTWRWNKERKREEREGDYAERSVERIYVHKDDSGARGQNRQRMKGTKRARIWTKWKETWERRDRGKEREKKRGEEMRREVGKRKERQNSANLRNENRTGLPNFS